MARAVAAELLSAGSADPDGARSRALSGAHPDLTWVTPSGAHEILVSDIDEPVVAAASKTPFEALRRVFVIERVDELAGAVKADMQRLAGAGAVRGRYLSAVEQVHLFAAWRLRALLDVGVVL